MTAANQHPDEQPIRPPSQNTNAIQPAADDCPLIPQIQPMLLAEPPEYDEPAGHVTDVIKIAFLRFQPPSPARYMVPRRFGMSAILGIMTALAMLFGGFRLLNAPPPVYLFFGLQTLVICFAQMLNGKTPRLASSVAGAVLVPLFMLPILLAEMRRWGNDDTAIAVFSLFLFGIPTGAFLGYLTGTCAAGIFLVMDYLEPYLQWQGRPSSSARP